MKKIGSILMFCFIFQFVNSQSADFECDNDPTFFSPIINFLKSAYVPDENTPIKYVKVNFHFMVKATGLPDNFTKTDDGTGNTNFTGYDYARNAVKVINATYLNNNRQMRLPPNNNTDVLPMQIRLVLQGVYFHYNDTHHYYENVSGTLLNNYYGINDACNIYIVGSHDNPANKMRGYANSSTTVNYRYIVIKNIWYLYENNPDPFYGVPGILHEFGHNIGLSHTIVGEYDGICCDGVQRPYCDDQCADTPTWEYIVNTLGEDDPCCWSGLECSNNIMDYSASRQALTPCQLGIAHEVIDLHLNDFMIRSHTSNITVCDIGYPTVTHIGKSITISGTSCSTQPVKIEDSQNIGILFNESVTIQSQFEIELGGELSVNTYEIL